MRYHAIALSSDICEDHHEDGFGKSTGCGYGNQAIGQTFDDMPSMLQHLANTFGLSGNEADYLVEPGVLHTTRMVADHSQAQNGGWFEPTEEEIASWQAGRLMLYSEHVAVRVLELN